ncbi:sugar ABC transporter ATP-binding protein [Aureimonas frigidaquae]|uniref:Sugar uptake ABC transporter ATP-binding protein n=1 Tax=Aureimonas frigidaquae TaxID=424757 RepID=A0A0P0Z1C7_9HYPH|nr:sugar ABC transporter ATP-binding protein [Aureimonas frigidaquae]BAT27723.1 sugar uptake ABC transporter ATP-binding protein [Aureimonas frigidaquae]
MTSEPALLEARGIAKSFFGIRALDNVDFTLRRGEVHALLGENGAGKSTLVKILTGAYRRDAGDIRVEGRSADPRNTHDAQKLGIGTVYQEVNLLPNLTVAENLFLGRQPRRFGLVDHRRMNADARRITTGYGLDIDVTQPLQTFSVAIRQIIAIARAIDLSGKVLILDEPTASLDAGEVEMIFTVIRKLRDAGVGIVIITHFLDQVFAICDHVTVLRNGALAGSRPIAGLDRMELISLMLGRALKEEVIHREPVEAGADRKPAFRFENYGRRGRIEPFDLSLAAGEVVGIAGLLGSGRTETARLLFGADRKDSGRAFIDGQEVQITGPESAIAARIGFCPEERKTEGIVEDLSVRENIILALQARRGWARPLSRREQARIADRFIKALDIRPADPERPIKFLSGGNQQKAVLARWLATEPRLLILDEPTRGIDVGAHAEIIRLIDALRKDGLSLVVISSELEELVVYAGRVVVLADRHHVAELTGPQVTPGGIMEAIAAHGHRGADAA